MITLNNSAESITHLKYLVVNEHDLLWGLITNSVGYQHIPPYSHYPLKNHPTRYLFSPIRGRILDEYQLIYISKGEGLFNSKSLVTPQRVTAGMMFLLFPGEWHTYKPDIATGWDEYWIGMKGCNIDSRVKNGFFSKQKALFSVGINEEIVNLYNQAISIASEQKSGFQQILAGIANHLLGLTYSLDKNQLFEESQLTVQINRAKVIMMEHLLARTVIEFESIADELNMSYSWFRRIFKQYTGFAPSQYIREVRIQKAKELLTNTNESIKAISYNLGFDNQEYFFTLFKQKTNKTPSEYRIFTQGI